ncbi:MAG TPA: AAA family ATPase [Candidatus Thermoplasmatota archaeon]|nr:AAA family ATPase [Candidatus Thermoplasmatota archaeon]
MRVIAFTGMPGAGKSVAVEVARKRGIPVLRMGDFIWEEVRRRGLPITSESVAEVAMQMRTDFGPGVWAEKTVDRLKSMHVEMGVIDGVRSEAELEVFRHRLGVDFTLVAIHASRATRMRRLFERHREDDVRDEGEFIARDERELGWGLGRVIALADVMLVNEDTMPDLASQVERVMDGRAQQRAR